MKLNKTGKPLSKNPTLQAHSKSKEKPIMHLTPSIKREQRSIITLEKMGMTISILYNPIRELYHLTISHK